MQNEEVKGDKPDLKGKLDVAGWYNTDKNGETYLSVVIASRVNLFPVEQEDNQPVQPKAKYSRFK